MSTATNRVTATCPAMVGNVAVGLDVLGHSVAGLSDSVSVARDGGKGALIKAISGAFAEGVPVDPTRNTASRAVSAVLKHCGSEAGVSIRIEKGIPVAAGLGGSAASAIAAVLAVNELLGLELELDWLATLSLAGERFASGADNWDNIYPALVGGLVLTVPSDPPNATRVNVPDAWRCVARLPQVRVETSQSRDLLPQNLSRETALRTGANLAAFMLACERGDAASVRRFFVDEIAEPCRSVFIPEFMKVIDAAMDAGALGASISGSGPSLFAWCESHQKALAVNQAMKAAWERENVGSRGWVSGIGNARAEVRNSLTESP